MFASEEPGPVHYAVRGDIFWATVQSPSHHSRTRFQTEIVRDGAETRDTSFWDKFCDFIHILKEIVGRLRLFNTWHP